MPETRWLATIPAALEGPRNKIDAQLLAGLDRYFTDHLETGGFLRAVLANDLHGALARAHPLSQHQLDSLVILIANTAPHGSWGSEEKVTAWLKKSP